MFGAFLLSKKVKLFFEHEDTSILDVYIIMNEALNDERQDMVDAAVSHGEDPLFSKGPHMVDVVDSIDEGHIDDSEYDDEDNVEDSNYNPPIVVSESDNECLELEAKLECVPTKYTGAKQK